MEAFHIPDSEALPEFTSVGAYSIAYLDREGEVVCPQCAEALRANGKKVTGFIHWEGESEFCADCNKELPSEYGIPEEG